MATLQRCSGQYVGLGLEGWCVESCSLPSCCFLKRKIFLPTSLWTQQGFHPGVFFSGISPEWLRATSFLGDTCPPPPPPSRNFFEMYTCLDAMWYSLDTILSYSVLRQRRLTSCRLILSRLNVFSDIVSYNERTLPGVWMGTSQHN